LDSPGRLGSQTTLAGEYIGGRAGKWYFHRKSVLIVMHWYALRLHFGALQVCKVDEDFIGLIFGTLDEDPTKWALNHV